MFLSAAAGGPAAAQQRAVCPDLPGVSATSNADNYRVLCEEDAESEKDIAIDLDKFDIVTSGRQHHGVAGIHHGPGGVAIDLANGSITVNEVNSHGVYGRIHGESNAGISSASNGAKDLRIEVTGMDIDIDVASGSSRTEKVNSHGIYGGHDGVGNLRIEATGTDIDIDMDLVGAYGTKAYGIYGRHGEKRGNLTIDVAGGSITTNRQDSDGIHGSHEGDGELDIDVVGIEIETDNFNASGIYGEHLGTGNLTIDVEDGSVYTEGTNSHGIEGRHDGAGNLRIETTDVDIDTAGADALDTSAYGIFGRHSGSSGDLTVDVRGGSIDTTQEGGHAVIAIIQPTGGDKGGGDIRIDVRGGSFRTRGKGSDGFNTIHRGASGNLVMDIRDADIDTESVDSGFPSYGISASSHNSTAGKVVIGVRGGSIDTKGGGAIGIRGSNRVASGTGDIDIDLSGGASVTTNGSSARGILGWNSGASSAGSVDIDLSGGASVTTSGAQAHGIYGLRWNSTGNHGTGDIAVRLDGGSSVTATGAGSRGIFAYQSGAADIDIAVAGGSSVMSAGHGVYGLHSGASGDIEIAVAGGADVDTTGANAYGIYGLNSGTSGTGDIDIGVSGGASATTSGDGAHGIYAGHVSGKGTMAVTVGAGSSVTADGANASGVQIGRFNTATNALERAAGIGGDGYRKQMVTVNGSVLGGSGDAAGIYLAGGGKAVVGPKGAVGADSGLAIYAARKLLTDPAPKLHVSLNLGGRRVGAVLGDDWIVNDGGETTILVNGVMLHDGATGATGNTAVNGAWDVAIRRDGRTVDRTDPDNWTISDRSESTIRDRDFSAADFTETQVRSGASPTPGPTPPAPTPPTPPISPDPTPPTPAPVPDGGSGGGAALGGGALLALLLLMFDPFDPAPAAPEAGTAPRPAFAQSADGGTRHWARGLSGPLSAAGGAAGVEFGLDAGLGGGFWLGVAAAPGMAAARADGSAAVSGARYGLRGGWRSEALFAGLSASRADWKAETAFAAPAGGLVAGAFDARQTDLRLGAGARLALGGGVWLAPKAEVFAGRLERGAQRAEGAAFRADMPDVEQDYRGWKAGLGLASGWRDGPRGVKLRPALNLSALRTESRSDSFALKQSDRLGIVETSVRARMAEAPETVLGLAAGVEAAGPGGLRLNFGYAALKSSGGGIDHALAAGLKLRF